MIMRCIVAYVIPICGSPHEMTAAMGPFTAFALTTEIGFNSSTDHRWTDVPEGTGKSLCHFKFVLGKKKLTSTTKQIRVSLG